jgi:hypothetical protein
LTWPGGKTHDAVVAKPFRPLVVVAALTLAGCDVVMGGPISASDCGFESAPLSFQGWTTIGGLGLGPDRGVPDLRIYAFVTRDEIELTTSPPGIDGSTFTLLGRGLCYAVDDPTSVHISAFGPTRRRDNPPPP